MCREIRDRDPAGKVILLSVYDDEQYLFQAMRVGASGYLLKEISGDELVRQLEEWPPARPPSTPGWRPGRPSRRPGCGVGSSGRARASA